MLNLVSRRIYKISVLPFACMMTFRRVLVIHSVDILFNKLNKTVGEPNLNTKNLNAEHERQYGNLI